MNILEPNEALRRVRLAIKCLEYSQKTPSLIIAGLDRDLALHNIRIAEEKLETLLAGMGNMIWAYRAREKETEPLRPISEN